MFIEFLEGSILKILPHGLILKTAQGVGYGLELPLSLLSRIPDPGASIGIWTYTLVREDALRLFGFASFEERSAFEILLSLNGVGPKLALAILSSLSLEQLKHVVENNDSRSLTLIPGVGQRMAEKILVELKPKVSRLVPQNFDRSTLGASILDSAAQPAKDPYVFEDLRSALENLGFKDRMINPLLQKLKKQSPEENFQGLMKKALVELNQSKSPEEGARF